MSVKVLAMTLALVGVLGARVAAAEEMPATVGPFWFAESVKSAQRKCETFIPTFVKGTKKVDHARCLVPDDGEYLLSFRAEKLIGISEEIDLEMYQICIKHVLEEIGPKGRGEDKDGYEFWGMALVANNVPAGTVICRQTNDGRYRVGWVTR